MTYERFRKLAHGKPLEKQLKLWDRFVHGKRRKPLKPEAKARISKAMMGNENWKGKASASR